MLALAVSLKLQQALEKEGAKVIMSRSSEKFFDNRERILLPRQSARPARQYTPNSAADPIR